MPVHKHSITVHYTAKDIENLIKAEVARDHGCAPGDVQVSIVMGTAPSQDPMDREPPRTILSRIDAVVSAPSSH